MIEALLLDAGGVFLLPNFQEVREVLAVEEEVQHRRAHHAGMAALDRTPAPGVYWPAYAAAAGRPPEPELVSRLSGIRWTSVIEESVVALRRIVQHGVPVAIVSNSDGTVEHDLLEFAVCQAGEGPGTAVAAVLDSTVVGVEKPDPRIFHLALERLGGIDPERALHVGDSVHFDVGGARAAGVRPLHLDPFGMCEGTDHEHLRSLGELDPLIQR